MDRRVLGAHLRQLRQQQGLTLRDLAAKAGLSHAYIEAIEAGRPNANPTLAALESLAEALKCTLTVVIDPPTHVHEIIVEPDERRRETLLRALHALRSMTPEDADREAAILALRAGA